MPKKNSLKTIKQLADELNLEKKRVEYQVSKLGDDSVPKIGGIRYLTNEAESTIRENLGFETLPKLDSDSGSDSAVDYHLKMLEKELQHKSDQLEAKDKQLEQLHKLLDQQQQLQLATNRQIEQLQQQNQLLLNNKSSKEEVDDQKKEVVDDKITNTTNDPFDLDFENYQKTIERRRRKRELAEQRLNQNKSNQPEKSKEINRKKWWKIW